MEARERDLFRLEHIVESAEKIEKIATSLGSLENFLDKWVEQDAMIRNFEIIDEAKRQTIFLILLKKNIRK